MSGGAEKTLARLAKLVRKHRKASEALVAARGATRAATCRAESERARRDAEAASAKLGRCRVALDRLLDKLAEGDL